jgi:uncharacterized SAM-binding protein YcdF (DUF218 family)
MFENEKYMKKVINCKLFYIVLAFVVFLIYVSCNIIAIFSYSNQYEDEKCDVAIVLGAAASDDGVSEVYKQRLNHAIKLFQNHCVEKIIVTGGKGDGNNFSDAFIARNYLVSQGIPEEIIILEEQSTITQENLENSKKIMDEDGYKTALVVSDPLHMKRAMLLAKDIGINAYSSPTQSSAYKSLKTQIPFVARETFFYIGYKWYRIFR